MSPQSECTALENRVTGERMVVLRRERDADGSLLEVQFDLPPHTEGPPLHRHTHLVERFEVLEGALQMTVEGRSLTLLAGDAVEVTPGQAHAFTNSSNTWVRFVTLIRSPGQFERFLRTWYGLANTGLARSSGQPRNLLFLARCLQDADFRFVGMPSGVQGVLLTLLVGLGELLGVFSALRVYESVTTPVSVGGAVA
ncbi:cupin domain-containing protein [Gemmatimonas phototrophica]|uniref:Cupin type-2 domain-containing protein n=1 Tax=Gemmatimonas phototrophica TaxID=1379270 RepID=A0A143BNL8_9BACT|nr:cupin domain-containing protein [Gemmatimonas phototrophica]AMW06185.1 hypothetical protein GEMMAAP_18135 [Gemmatimonas phototrophica]